MTPEFLVDIATKTFRTALLLAAPSLIAGLLAGVVISILQSITQIQEQTLVMVPKMFAVVVIILLTLPWMLQTLLSFTSNLFIHLPDFVR